MTFIRKSSGEKQHFDLSKFRRSLLKAGASDSLADRVLSEIKNKNPKSTQEIHEMATTLLKEYAPPIADRYNLKQALMALGPDGYSFESYIGELFVAMRYKVQTSVVIPGACVEHEIDVVAQKEDHHYIVECKFHNRAGIKSNVKIPLYIQARFEDIRDAWEKKEKKNHAFHQAWLVTNTKFTTQAIKYGTCKNITMIGWGYPKEGNLAQLIEKHQLFPITTLLSLTKEQQRTFLKHGLVLCKDAHKHAERLKKLGVSDRAIAAIIKEAQAVCAL